MWMRLVCPGTVHFLFLRVSAEGWDDAKHFWSTVVTLLTCGCVCLLTTEQCSVL